MKLHGIQVRVLRRLTNESSERLSRVGARHRTTRICFGTFRVEGLWRSEYDCFHLHDGLHPALKALNLPRAGMHAFRQGCNRRWELAGLNPAVLRQQMGHSSAGMTARYTGEIPLAQVRQAFSDLKTRLLANEVAA